MYQVYDDLQEEEAANLQSATPCDVIWYHLKEGWIVLHQLMVIWVKNLERVSCYDFCSTSSSKYIIISDAEKFSENLYVIANEPTLACYRIQEHVHKSGPMLIDRGVCSLFLTRKNLY